MTIAIVDYGMGNLRSVQKALEHVGAQPLVTDKAEDIAKAEKVILPGVGAFGDAMRELEQRGLIDVVKQSARSGKPFLGICLGLQLLFEVGEESGNCPGLGLFAGKAVRFQLPHEFKVPHMGWNQVQSNDPSNPLQHKLQPNSYFYFVHSYYVVPEDPSIIWYTSEYAHPFCAAIRSKNVFATQFHPEKSQSVGLQLLENFARL